MASEPTAPGRGIPEVRLPAHGSVVEPWRQRHRGGTRDDRMFSEVTASLPPIIAGIDTSTPSALRALCDDGMREIVSLDSEHGHHLTALSALLLRAESVASSKIEHINASVDDYARALHGNRSNSSASSMVASTQALNALVRSVENGHDINLDAIITAHQVLMVDDEHEADYAGRLRDMQNWIGGSDHSPRGALYVPPPPRTVDAYLEDLIAYANRRDVGVLEQAAIVHAQFESIHPFTDGNGRIGRALVNTIFRRRGTTRTLVVPLASAVVARRDEYFDSLGAYRAGDAGPLIASFATGSAIAASESRLTAARLADLPEQWMGEADSPRRGSAAAKIIDSLLENPIFSTDEIVERLGGAASSIYTAVDRLASAGVLRPLTKRTKNQVWVAAALADELDDLGVRIAAKATGKTL